MSEELVPVWVPETGPEWRPYQAPAEYARCRWTMPSRKACGAPGVADLARGTTGKQRWSYCRDHLYGRLWVEGRLYKTVMRPPADVRLLALSALLVGDLVEMDASTAISLATWPAAEALVRYVTKGAR